MRRRILTVRLKWDQLQLMFYFSEIERTFQRNLILVLNRDIEAGFVLVQKTNHSRDLQKKYISVDNTLYKVLLYNVFIIFF